MFSFPIPFKEKGALKTWDIQKGYPVDCTCYSSGDTVSVDLSPLEVLISSGNDISQDILDQLVLQNRDVQQFIITGTTAGNIPAGVQSYTIINLGADPSDPNSTITSMFVNGLEVNSKFVTFGNSTDTNQVLSAVTPYDPNGNVLLIIYNIPI